LNEVNYKNLKKAYKEAFGEEPKDVNAQLVTRTLFYKQILYNIVKGRIDIRCPIEWDEDYILDALLIEGKFCITDTELGKLPLKCSPYGLNVFQRANCVNIVNPAFDKVLKRKIDKNCVLYYLYDNTLYRGISWILDVYSEKLASCDGAIDVNLINSKVAFIFDCASKKQADEMKKIYSEISRGKPAVYYHGSNQQLDINDNKLVCFTLPVKNNFIAPELQDQKRTIMNEFLSIFGINTNNVEKKERLIESEVDANNQEILFNIEYSKKILEKCNKKTSKMFPDIDFYIQWKEIEENVSRETLEVKNESN